MTAPHAETQRQEFDHGATLDQVVPSESPIRRAMIEAGAIRPSDGTDRRGRLREPTLTIARPTREGRA